IADCVTVVSLARQVLELAAGGAPPDWDAESAMPSGPEQLLPKAFCGARGKGRAYGRVIADAARDSWTSPMRLAADVRVPPGERFTRIAHRSIVGAEYHALLAECGNRHILPEAAVGAALAMA